MPHERRLSTRKTPEYLAYISLPSDNGGIVIDVSEGGLGFHSVAPVEADGPIHFRFAMDSPERVKAVGELAWKDESGKTCGVRFTELPDEVRERIRVWIGQSNSGAKSRAKASAFDIPGARPVFEAVAASISNAELAPVMAAANPLLYNLTPAVRSAPSKRLAMLPVELDFRAGATAAVVPQFVQMLDGMAEQVRIWVAESRTSAHADPIADSALETEIALKSEIELSPAVDIPVAEPEIEAEAAPSNKVELSPVEDIPVAEPSVEPEMTPGRKTELPPVVAAGNPLHYNSKPPIFNVSLFPLEPNSETGTADFAVPEPVPMKHPIAAVGLTIALAFLVSTGIFSYVCTTRAGDLLFDWGEKMWGGVSSQPISQTPAPVASSVPDSSKPPQQ
ncbi:MAG: PilZ domain-containing protein [Candidatus Acidiferrales bacterium]